MATALARYRGVLRHRDLRLILTAYVVDACGTWASTVVLTAWVFERTGSLVWLAALACTRWIPGVLAAPFAGVLADRVDRRTVLVASAASNGVIAGGITAVVAASGPPWAVLALLTASTVVGSPYRPAAGAMTPDVVDEPELPTANSLLAAVENLVLIVGPAVGAALLLLDAPAVGLGINTASFLLAAAIAARLRVRSRGRGRGNALRQVVRGAATLRATPTAGVLIAFVAVDTMLAWAYGVVYIPLAGRLGLGPDGYGVLLIVAAVGGVVGAVVADRLIALPRVAPVMIGGVLLQALPYAACALTDQSAIGVVLMGVSGTGMVVVEVVALVAVQREVPIARLSSVLGVLDLTTLLASAVGSFVAAGVFSALSVPAALLVVGLGDAALALLLAPWLVRADRRAAKRTAALRGRVGLLRALPLFAGFSERRLETLAAAVVRRRLGPEEVLLRQGDPADALWILVDGRLRVWTRSVPVGGIPDVTGPDVVGEIGVLRGLARTATVAAASPCIVWRIGADEYVDSLSTQRIPRMMSGAPNVRLARTDPELVETA